MTREENLSVVRDLLLLADVKVPLWAVKKWSGRELDQAEKWAAAVHLAASDHRIEIPECPLCVAAFRPPTKGRAA
jgi:hypothetical protein